MTVPPESRRTRRRHGGEDDLTGPIRLRQERAVRRRRRRLLVALGIGLVLVAGAWGLWFSPLFATRTVDVRGTSLLTPEQVTGAAQVPPGLPLPQQDRAAIEARVRTLAPVREVEVVRSWPHTLGIRISERTPVVAFTVNGGFLLVDSEGVAYAQVPEQPADLLRAEGDSVDTDLTSAVGRTVGALPDDIRSQVLGVRADSPAAITLELKSGTRVVWGDPENAELKGQVLAVLRDQVPDATSYDVSVPAFPTTQ